MKKGFTLIELIVLIAIIAILGTIIVASLNGEGRASDENTSTAIEASLPEPTNYVTDVSNVLTDEQEVALNAKLEAFDWEMAVVFVPTTQPLSIEEYSIRLAEKWKVGDRDLDNGIILLIATEDRKIRIEIGRGVEGLIPDSVAGQIRDDVLVPHLKAGDWYAGADATIDALNARI